MPPFLLRGVTKPNVSRHGLAPMRTTTAVIAAAVALVFARGAANGQFVGGEAVYDDADTRREEPAPGVLLYLVGGAFDSNKGLPDPMSEVLDQDYSATAAAGDDPADRGTFVLISKNSKHPELTIVHFPWSRDGKQTSGLLSRVVKARITQKDGNRRAKIRLNCTPTNATLETVEDVSRAVRDAYVASQLARLLDYGDDVRQTAFESELAIVASMVSPDKRADIVGALSASLARSLPFLERKEIERWSAVLRRGDFDQSVRLKQTEAWRRINAIDVGGRSLDSLPDAPAFDSRR